MPTLNTASLTCNQLVKNKSSQSYIVNDKYHHEILIFFLLFSFGLTPGNHTPLRGPESSVYIHTNGVIGLQKLSISDTHAGNIQLFPTSYSEISICGQPQV